MLRREFGARRVGVFGSLAAGRFGEGSDLDLYVDRIRRGGYFEAVDRACEAAGVPVDLVEYERAPASLRETIDREGEDLDAD